MYYIQQTNYKNKILLRSPFVFLRPSCIWSQFLSQLSKFKKSRRTIKIDNFIQFLTLFHVYISVITLSWTNELQLWKITPFTHMIPNTFNAFFFYFFLFKNSPYPDCDEYGVVTRDEVQLWNTKFRVSRQIAAVDKLSGPKKSNRTSIFRIK